MLDLLAALKDTPVPTILVIFGGLFILGAIAGGLDLLKIPPLQRLWQRGTLGTVGSLFLILGLVLYLLPISSHQQPGSGGPPAPTPTATQPTAFRVTRIDATVSPTAYDCSQSRITFNFSATITISPGSTDGTITYTWGRSDGATMTPSTIAVPAGQTTGTVTTTWTLGSGVPNGTYWEQVVVTSPNNVSSNQATFTVSC